MNKLLLVALLGCTLLALTAGSEDNSESSLQIDPVQTLTREVREAKRDPEKKGGKGKKGGNKKKGGKTKKGKKTRNTRKTKKGKKINKNLKKKQRSQKKKDEKKKKNGKKSEQKGKKQKKNKKSTKSVRQTCNADPDCLTLAVKYMKAVKDKVKNFNAQKSRIEKFQKLSTSKAGKKGAFDMDLSRLKEAGGGNASALTCQGKGSGSGQEAIKGAVDKLTACKDNIKAKCETDKPAYNKTEADACSTKMEAISTAVETCTKETDAKKICICWKAADIKAAFEAISSCTLATTNTAVATFKKACTASFAECRQTQDTASSVIFACNAANTADKLVAKLKTVTENKESVDKLTETAQSKATKRIKRAASCGDFIKNSKMVADMAKNFIASPKIKEKADAINNDPPASCTEDEKATLISDVVTALVEASSSAIDAIATIQADLLVQTGSTASSADIAAVTTASATTKAPTGRRILRDMFHM